MTCGGTYWRQAGASVRYRGDGRDEAVVRAGRFDVGNLLTGAARTPSPYPRWNAYALTGVAHPTCAVRHIVTTGPHANERFARQRQLSRRSAGAISGPRLAAMSNHTMPCLSARRLDFMAPERLSRRPPQAHPGMHLRMPIECGPAGSNLETSVSPANGIVY